MNFCKYVDLWCNLESCILLQNQAQLTAAESRLSEAKKQYDLMLESKQLELSRHLKEISQRNDQVFLTSFRHLPSVIWRKYKVHKLTWIGIYQEINDIRRKYEVEKLEIVNMEKEKVHLWLWYCTHLALFHAYMFNFDFQADKTIGGMGRKCDQKLAECKEEAKQQLKRIQEEHAAIVCARN